MQLIPEHKHLSHFCIFSIRLHDVQLFVVTICFLLPVLMTTLGLIAAPGIIFNDCDSYVVVQLFHFREEQ